jgi:hypothetical protein
MLLDPELAKRVVATYEGRLTIQQLGAFLTGYATATGQGSYFNDIADELRYYDEEMKRLNIPENRQVGKDLEKTINDIVDNYQ